MYRFFIHVTIMLHNLLYFNARFLRRLYFLLTQDGGIWKRTKNASNIFRPRYTGIIWKRKKHRSFCTCTWVKLGQGSKYARSPAAVRERSPRSSPEGRGGTQTRHESAAEIEPREYHDYRNVIRRFRKALFSKFVFKKVDLFKFVVYM